MNDIYVIKRDGRKEKFQLSKIRKQIEFACAPTSVSPLEIESLLKIDLHKPDLKTSDIQEIIIGSIVKNINIDNKEWDLIAGRAAMFDLYRNVYKVTGFDPKDWREHIKWLTENNRYRTDILSKLEKMEKERKLEFLDDLLENFVTGNYDFQMVYSQVQVIKSKYLLKSKRKIIEYPVLTDIVNSIILCDGTYEDFKILFEMIHNQYISLATPFKANLRIPNGSVTSCFIGENIDSLAGIAKAWKDMAKISQEGGGIGWDFSKIRPGDSYTDNVPKSNTINKWLKIVNDIMVAVNQRGIRPGALTPAIPWWHLDVFDFIDMKSELNGDLREKCFDLFPQVTVDNYFIDAVLNDEEVYLFDQKEYKDLTCIDITELVDEKLYETHKHVEKLINENKLTHYKKIKARDLWKKILWVWVEIGDFYIAHKDNINKANYLKNDPQGGITKNVNLCCESYSLTKAPTQWASKSINDGDREITIETDGRYHACNLCSINLTNLVDKSEEFIKLVSKYAVIILDRGIDLSTFPVLEAELNSKELRNIGIGFVGMADYMAYNNKMFDTEDGQRFAEALIERFSWYVHNTSVELAKEKGSYPLFKPENYYKILGHKPEELENFSKANGNNFPWRQLQQDIFEHGIRNFYLLSPAPNTSTAILNGSTASFLPVYNKEMYQTMSNQSVPIIPKFIKEKFWLYKTKFDYIPKDIINYTRRLQRWIDAGISLEININPALTNIKEISDAILDGFKSGELKAIYYSLTIDGKKQEGCVSCAN